MSFIHFSYKKRQYKHILLHTFLIKEFENRWYVIGFSETHNDIRTFGLDRITNPLLMNKKFIPTDREKRKAYQQVVYGVFPIPEAKKETIKIHVSQLGTHYFQAYPLHESQRIQKENYGTSIITYEVIPSVELARYFLSQGYHVEVIKPKWFKSFIQKLNQ
jgi:predicted DNA-binding transcriptional regulator YafY